MLSSALYLSEHAYFCLADRHYVFLDLRCDEYLCLGRVNSKTVEAIFNGTRPVNEQSAGIQLGDNGASGPSVIIDALLQKKLLVQDERIGKPVAAVSVDIPVGSLVKRSDKHRMPIRPAHVWTFFSAATVASRDLRDGSIERTVRKVEARKSAYLPDAVAVDDVVITGLFRIFQTLRPLFPRPYLCLFDSLALLHFLARFRVFPQWVYGVKLEPFAAHCWVQTGNLVVNDVIDNVRDYEPILVV